MTIKQFFANKYRFFIFIILLYAGVDILLHKGISRVLIPEDFAGTSSQKAFISQANNLASTNKHWLKAVNTADLMEKIPAEISGIEWDVHFDTTAGCFRIFHDSSTISNITDSILLNIYERRKLRACIWFDFKNLSEENSGPALAYCLLIRKKYKLENKMIIESSFPQFLNEFSAKGFFTSYYVPFFNPYQMEKDSLNALIDTISSNLKKYPVSALSGYYFQYPFLKKYFTGLPILTWTDNYHFSVVACLFNTRLERDTSIKVILSPFEN